MQPPTQPGLDLTGTRHWMTVFKNQVRKAVEEMDEAGRSSWACLSDSRAVLASVDERLAELNASGGAQEQVGDLERSPLN